MRDTFVLYTEYEEQFELLSDAQAGVLIKAILAFNADKEIPEMDALTKMAFINISNQIKRDSEKYKKMLAQRSAAGRRNGKAETEEKSTSGNPVKRESQPVKRESQPVKRDVNPVEHNEDEDVDEDVDVDVNNDVDEDVDEDVDVKKAKTSAQVREAYFVPTTPELEDAFKGFVEMRKKIRAPMTDHAIKLATKKVEGLARDALDNFDAEKAVEIINQSVMNGWKGFYPLKHDKPPDGEIDWARV